MKIGFVGMGKLGVPAATVMQMCGHDVLAYDIDPKRREQVNDYPWREQGVPFHDFVRGWGIYPFQELLEKHPVSWADSIEQVAAHAEIIFVAVQTPHEPKYDGCHPLPETTADFDYRPLEDCLRSLVGVVRRETVVAVISTVAPGTFKRLLEPILAGTPIRYCYNPYFIAMGTVVPDMLKPEFVLIGGEDETAAAALTDFYSSIHSRPCLRMSIPSAEISKMAYNCYAADTDVLTNQGWRRFSALDGQESILSLNPETRHIEWARIRKVVHRPHDGEMIRFHSAKDDVLVTPEHYMFVGTLSSRSDAGKNYSYRWHLRQAGEVVKLGQFSFCRSASWTGEDPPHIDIAGRAVPTALYAEFMGWYLGEGSVTGNAITIAQSHAVNPEKYARIAELARRMLAVLGIGAGGHYGPRAVVISNRGLAEHLRPLGKSLNKAMPEELKALAPHYLRLTLDALCEADGSKQAAKRWSNGSKPLQDRRYYSTSSPQLAAEIAELITKVGHHPSCRVQKSRLSGRDNYLVYELTGATSYHQRSARAGLKWRREHYKGDVWCAMLDRNHVMLTRRNGKCAWHGNTFITAKICFANSLMEMADRFGGNVDDVTDLIKQATDRLVSPRYLTAGVGDAGNCHPRDGIVLSFLANQVHDGVEQSFDFAGAMMRCREAQANWLCWRIFLSRTERNLRRVVILGLTFKPETNSEAGSTAVLVANMLAQMGSSPLTVLADPVSRPGSEVEAMREPAVFLIGCKHERFRSYRFPPGSVVIDPHRYIPDQDGVTVRRLGEGPRLKNR